MTTDTQKLREALDKIEDALHDAYQNAGQECCGHGRGGECCGNAEPVWDAADQKIMDVLGPIQKTLSDALPQPSAQDREDAEAQAYQDVLAERRRQVEAEGWTPEHDDEHADGAIALAAASYAIESQALTDGMVPSDTRDPPPWWPWAREWWKSSNPRRNLVKAGALILAEIERIDRAAARAAKERT